MFELIRSNKRRSILLVAGFVAFVALVGAAIGALVGNGIVFTLVALVLSGVVAFTSYWRADRIALAVSRARPAPPDEYQRLHNLVEGLCIAGGLPKPGVYVIDDPAPNAFATGRNPNHAAIAVTTGLLEKMNRVELEGVVAHELSHIRNYDILVSTLAVVMVGTVALIADMAIRMMWWNGGRVARNGDRADSNNPLAYVGIVLLITAPIIAKIMQATISRSRETLADVSVCQLTRSSPRVDLSARKTQGRHHGDAFRVHRYGTLVDRAAHEWRRRRRQIGRRAPNVRHPPPARRANCPPERTLMKLTRLLAGLGALALDRCSLWWRRRFGRLDLDHIDVDHVHHGPCDHQHQAGADHHDHRAGHHPSAPHRRTPRERRRDPAATCAGRQDRQQPCAPCRITVALRLPTSCSKRVVEGRTTRFAAVFHSQSCDPLGPIRSGRIQDITLFTSFNEPLFVWSGGNRVVTRAINDSYLINLGPNNATGYYRGPGRAPHNFYNTTDNIWFQTPEGHPGPPPPHFQYLEADEEFDGEPISRREGTRRYRTDRVDLESRVRQVRSIAARS